MMKPHVKSTNVKRIVLIKTPTADRQWHTNQKTFETVRKRVPFRRNYTEIKIRIQEKQMK
jgi:hypothetical protein